MASNSVPLNQPSTQEQTPPSNYSNSVFSTSSEDAMGQITDPCISPIPTLQALPDIWNDTTPGDKQTMFGLRRFRTSHLVDLKMIEKKLEILDRAIHQAGLRLPQHISKIDNLGLKDAKMDFGDPNSAVSIDEDLILSLRKTIKEYNEALIAFNSIMTLETFSLIDNVSKASVMQELRTQDSELHRTDSSPTMYLSMERTRANTARIAEIFTRFMIALVAGAALIVPLTILSLQTTAQNRLLVVGVCIAVFSLIVSTLSKASNYEVMAASAAYSAVLTVFLSYNPGQ